MHLRIYKRDVTLQRHAIFHASSDIQELHDISLQQKLDFHVSDLCFAEDFDAECIAQRVDSDQGRVSFAL